MSPSLQHVDGLSTPDATRKETAEVAEVVDCEQLPSVTIIIPTRNETDHIARCLTSILDSDYPHRLLEILVVDGMSDDGTAEVVGRMMAADTRVRLLANPDRIVPHAMNRGIEAARGEIIIRVDGHAEIEPGFVRQCVQELDRRPECWCVGGPIESVNSTRMGQIIAAAMSHPVGVGNARFRIGGYNGYVDTVAFGAYRREVFDRIGGFDEELVRNQDDELNARLIQRGGRIWMSESIRSRYFPRTNLRKLWRQYYQYGFWRIRTIQKLGRPATIRQLMPVVLVSALLALAVMWALVPAARTTAAVLAGIYPAYLCYGAVRVGQSTGLLGFLLAPVVFATLHFAYGFGSLHGLVWFGLLRRRTARHGLSR